MLKIRLGFAPFLIRAGSDSCPFQRFSRYLRMVRSLEAQACARVLRLGGARMPRASRAGGEPQPFTFHHYFIMAKGNMLLGFSRGSVGDLTFYRRNSQQVARARARVVKNPKTLAQQMQRAIMRTSVEAYKILKEVCDHSWEGVAYGANSYAEFQKQNMSMLRRLAAAGGQNTKSFLPSGFNGLVAMPWVLSKGSIAWNGLDESKSAAEGDYIVLTGNYMPSITIDTITYAQFCDMHRLQQGDQITLISARKRSDVDESSAVEINVSRLILAPGLGEFAETVLFDPNGRVNDPNPLNEGMDFYNARLGNGTLSFVGQPDPDVDTIGVAVIVSRRASDGSWLRSPSTFVFNQTEQEGGYTLRQASMVVNAEIVTPSDWYLNNANEGSGE